MAGLCQGVPLRKHDTHRSGIRKFIGEGRGGTGEGIAMWAERGAREQEMEALEQREPRTENAEVVGVLAQAHLAVASDDISSC